MKQRKDKFEERPERRHITEPPEREVRERIYDEPIPTVMNTEWTGLYPTPEDTEAENIAFGEIETPLTGKTVRADEFHDAPTGS